MDIGALKFERAELRENAGLFKILRPERHDLRKKSVTHKNPTIRVFPIVQVLTAIAR